MRGYSIPDGFSVVNDSVGEMIQNVANEPSVGLYYVQQHTRDAAHNLLRVRNRVVDRSHEVALLTADLEDSIGIVRSMKELGVPIADQMSKEINKSLMMLSSLRPSRRHGIGGSFSSTWGQGLRLPRSGSWGQSLFGSTLSQERGNRPWYRQSTPSHSIYVPEAESSSIYTPKAVEWSRHEGAELENVEADPSAHSDSHLEELNTGGDQELPVSTQSDEQEPHVYNDSLSQAHEDYTSLQARDTEDDYEKFKSDRQVKLEEWLEGDKGKTR